MYLSYQLSFEVQVNKIVEFFLFEYKNFKIYNIYEMSELSNPDIIISFDKLDYFAGFEWTLSVDFINPILIEKIDYLTLGFKLARQFNTQIITLKNVPKDDPKYLNPYYHIMIEANGDIFEIEEINITDDNNKFEYIITKKIR
jgi:hypothetical protein